MDRLSDVLPRILRQRGLHEHAVAGQILLKAAEWIAITLPAQSSALFPVRFQQATLVIEATQSIALCACTEQLEGLTSHLRGLFPTVKIQEIRVMRR